MTRPHSAMADPIDSGVQGAGRPIQAIASTTRPMMTSTGAARPALATASGRPASVVSQTRCCSVVPLAIAAAGVVAGRPAAISCALISGRLARPM